MVELEEKLGVLESEWTKRRNELITARQDLDRMERDKINRVLHGRFLNVEGGAERSAEELENQEPMQ